MVHKILSQNVYRGPPSVSSAPKIAPEEHKSMQGGQPNASFSFGEYKPRIVKINNIPFVETITSNNRYLSPLVDYLKPGHGYFSQRDDFEIDGMKSAGEDNPPNKNDAIPKMPNLVYITGVTPLGLYLPNERDTKVKVYVTPRIVEAVDSNRIGFYESLKGNLQQKLRNIVLFNDINNIHYDTAEWIEFLEREGLPVKKHPVLGIGIQKGDLVAAMYPNEGYLVAAPDFYQRAKSLASEYGLTEREAVEAMERSILLHEILHAYGIKSERLQGELQAKFYSGLADKVKGTKWERIYRALAQEGRDYAKAYSLSNIIWREITKNPFEHEMNIQHVLVRKFYDEAIEKEIPEKEIGRYIRMRVKETIGNILVDGPSLEERLNKISDARDTNENMPPTYEGRRVYGEGASMPTELITKRSKDTKHQSKSKKTYESIDKSEYKSMSDVKELKAEKKTSNEAANTKGETPEAPEEGGMTEANN